MRRRERKRELHSAAGREGVVERRRGLRVCALSVGRREKDPQKRREKSIAGNHRLLFSHPIICIREERGKPRDLLAE